MVKDGSAPPFSRPSRMVSTRGSTGAERGERERGRVQLRRWNFEARAALRVLGAEVVEEAVEERLGAVCVVGGVGMVEPAMRGVASAETSLVEGEVEAKELRCWEGREARAPSSGESFLLLVGCVARSGVRTVVSVPLLFFPTLASRMTSAGSVGEWALLRAG